MLDIHLLITPGFTWLTVLHMLLRVIEPQGAQAPCVLREVMDILPRACVWKSLQPALNDLLEHSVATCCFPGYIDQAFPLRRRK